MREIVALKTILLTLSDECADWLEDQAAQNGCASEEFLQQSLEKSAEMQLKAGSDALSKASCNDVRSRKVKRSLRPEDFLSPEQRLDMIADILVTMVNRSLEQERMNRKQAEQEQADPNQPQQDAKPNS